MQKNGNIDNVAHNLKIFRKTSGLSQESLAQKIQIDRTAIVHYEAGERIPNLAILIDIASVLNKSLDDFIKD